MPITIPYRDASFFNRIADGSLADVAYEISRVYFGDTIPDEALVGLVQSAFPFDTPVHELDKAKKYVLELFHGPSLAFKDVGARYMAAFMSYFSQKLDREINILVATSGDTGGAVAMGFHNVEGVRVSILYPKNRVSDLQEKQLTTLGGNIQAFEVDGSFDDCQAIVKTAFLDSELNKIVSLSSANSINIFRLIPQSFYYIRAYGQLKQFGSPLVFSTPSGNFGNLSAGVLAQRMGLPVRKFIAATNLNNVVPNFLYSGIYEPKESVSTISNAMDVGNPSNFVRLCHLYGNDLDTIKQNIEGYFFTDEETEEAMQRIYQQYNYVACPHTAIGIRGLDNYLDKDTQVCGVALATAHPSKFKPLVESILGQPVDVPERLAHLANRTKQVIAIPADFQAFKESLLQTVS
ncbi:threonine synthase [Nibrella saemangeumensis]|uniref:Threonine synthase n=2 Tax=Nibrella saemangeumensis TaxID=1084526 RepID=A0ABP8MXT9_9BACT